MKSNHAIWLQSQATAGCDGLRDGHVAGAQGAREVEAEDTALAILKDFGVYCGQWKIIEDF
jgi:hypothetical protein